MPNQKSNELDEEFQIIAEYEGFKNTKEMLIYLLKDSSFNAIADFLGTDFGLIRLRIKKYNLQKYVRPKGGPNSRRCADKKWRFRARRLGFDNEREMLNAYLGNFKELILKLKKDVRINENTTDIITQHTIKYRCLKKKIKFSYLN